MRIRIDITHPSASLPVFRQASRFSKAMLAYEKALDWQELFDIAFSLRLQDQISEGDLVATAYSVAGRFPFIFFVTSLSLL